MILKILGYLFCYVLFVASFTAGAFLFLWLYNDSDPNVMQPGPWGEGARRNSSGEWVTDNGIMP